jgi:type VI secretion system protein ImpK
MRLSDCFIGVVAYVVYFLKSVGKKHPPYEQVKADILRLLSESEACFKEGHFPQDDYDLARFAVCAWVDEAILNSGWHEKDQWQREQLQRFYYHIADAGEAFFSRLNALGPHQRDVREVYYLCLALGFMGRYCTDGDKYLLDQVKTSNLKLLIGSSVGLPSLERTDLFPEAYPSEPGDVTGPKEKFSFTPFILICLGGPIILFMVLYISYAFILNGIGENFLSKVP